ncbi:hypothetical protein SmaMPs15_000176 [Stenotrophomonas maltophilia phage vB_SmaM_Ps15]|uniref:Uncharacterized protein n=1 Tax=Stenotrophomonas maltophilia phage vB_SmaM_Ps15 TaxID=3071007 RepID=A0AAE9JV15_9CAUD|nr:hypothetical protein PQC01_gp176 [Stenotrophomonas maltophilia phage vB_SmaM_Ps15]UMO77327.1 hypothetical protein SmaMPs15_000176 [Stenotrophomonas maltophilia phage vB_SmaM_Ps15]
MVSLYNVFFGSLPVSFENVSGVVDYVQNLLGMVVDSETFINIARMSDGDQLTVLNGAEAVTITLE